ncbi:uncharacterized protein GIIIspla2 [Bactrocera oleae]|uniref:uncharacterized protein GIIIspla2 n=1 Tax=Bactrocera oleae TaxID=104688 RepID=UPI0006B82D3B|nr:uncharacterized protein LOC106618483 [Bactrocera oleae]
MTNYHKLCLYAVFLLLSCCTTQTWSAYLPVNEEHNLNQLEGLQKQQSQRYLYTERPADKSQIINKGETRSAVDTTATADTNNAAIPAWYSATDEDTATLGNWQLLPHGSYDKNDDVVAGNAPIHAVAWSDRAYENSDVYDAFDSDGDTELDSDNDNDMNNGETGEELTNAYSVLSRKRRGFDDWLIAPHTRWCGRGNNANNNYNQLGGASDADRCCRRHDHCPVYISAFSNRYEIFNYRPYTLSHCSCDRRFRACLKMNNDEPSNTIGQLFFNMVPSQCFILRNERHCLERDAKGNCVKETTRKHAYVRENEKY